MSKASLKEFVGSWQGTVQTWFEPTSEPIGSSCTGQIRSIVRGQFIVFEYAWTMQEEPQEGALTFGFNVDSETYVAAWVDSFHSATDIMNLLGEPKGDMSVKTTYGPPDEPWGWRMQLVLLGDTLVIGHFNVPPGQPEYLAVEFRLHRV